MPDDKSIHWTDGMLAHSHRWTADRYQKATHITRPAAAVAVWICLVCACHSQVSAQDGRLIDSEPYDLIVLNEQNRSLVLKVQPLDLPDRKLPVNPRPSDTLRARLISNPDEELQVSWSGIARIELFEQKLLEEARRLLAERRFDEAFEYLTFIHQHYPQTTDVDQTVDQLLYTEASALFQQAEYERALLLLDELYQRTPNRRGLATALSRVLERSFDNALQQQDYSYARRLYEQSEAKYAAVLQELLESWQKQLSSIGTEVVEAMRADLEAGRHRDAYLKGRRVLEIWPATSGAKELMSVAAQRYPLLRVGVQQLGGALPHGNAEARMNWSVRRTERLQSRQLVELDRIGPDGAEYACFVGDLVSADDRRSVAVQVDLERAGGPTSNDLAQLLLKRDGPTRIDFDPAWAARIERVATADLATVRVDFRVPQLRPAALLQLRLDNLDAVELALACKPYLTTESLPDSQRFLLNSEYARASATQPREVVEQLFATAYQAEQALRSGELDLIDRAFPADVDRLRRDSQLVVVPYRLPTVHVLIPNYQRPHVGNRLFRRGLTYAIDRQKILKRDLLAGTSLPGCQVISGPFSAGRTDDDPMAYAYDPRIEPRAYDPRHAKTLLQLAHLEVLSAAEHDEQIDPTLAVMILVHPPNEIARIACAEIVEDLRVIGVDCQARPLAADEIRPTDDNWDLLYAEYVIPEPVVEARDLLAAQGFVGSPNPYLNLALRQLDVADSWNRAGERLRVIHQLCFDDTTVIPLWQLIDYLVYRHGVEGVVSEPMTTYQNIEAWRFVAEE